jgi:oligoribonuclease
VRYCSLDTETAGLNEKVCNLIEFAAVLDDTKNQRPLNKLPKFHRYILPPDGRYYTGEAMALSFHADIFRKIATWTPSSDYIVIPPERLGQEFAQFLRENGVEGKITVAGKNFSSFDLGFLMQVPEFQKHVGLERTDTTARVTLAKRTIDPAIMYWNPDEDLLLPDTKLCIKRAGIDQSGTDHTAMADALDVVQLVRVGLSRFSRPNPYINA